MMVPTAASSSSLTPIGPARGAVRRRNQPLSRQRRCSARLDDNDNHVINSGPTARRTIAPPAPTVTSSSARPADRSAATCSSLRGTCARSDDPRLPFGDPHRGAEGRSPHSTSGARPCVHLRTGAPRGRERRHTSASSVVYGSAARAARALEVRCGAARCRAGLECGGRPAVKRHRGSVRRLLDQADPVDQLAVPDAAPQRPQVTRAYSRRRSSFMASPGLSRLNATETSSMLGDVPPQIHRHVQATLNDRSAPGC